MRIKKSFSLMHRYFCMKQKIDDMLVAKFYNTEGQVANTKA